MISNICYPRHSLKPLGPSGLPSRAKRAPGPMGTLTMLGICGRTLAPILKQHCMSMSPIEEKREPRTGFRMVGGRLDQLVQSKVKSSLMVEIRLTRQSRLLKPTRPGLVRPGPPSNGICYFYHYILLSNKAFLNKNYCFYGLYGGDSASL